VVVDFECKNDFFEPVQKSVVIELMGRSSNMILLDDAGRIIDAVRRADLSNGRCILPSAKFEPAPVQSGKRPFIEDFDVNALISNPELTLERAIMSYFCGISPLNAREIAYLSTGVSERLCTDLSLSDKNRLCDVIDKIRADIKTNICIPTLVTQANNGKLVDFSFMPIRQYAGFCNTTTFETPSEVVEAFFEDSAKKARFEQKTKDLSQLLTRLSSRVMRTKAVREKELADSQKAEQYRIFGELINANLYRMENGMSKLETENYFDDCKPVTVPLKVALSPSANAQVYFKKYTKAKNSAGILKRLIAQDEAELKYIESVFLSLCDCETVAQAEEIRTELITGGYMKKGAKSRVLSKVSAPKSLEFEGFSILVGKNNMQNDLVTVKLSRKDDIWLHTKSIHSSHVLIQCRGAQPPDTVIEYAAGLCAHYSKGKNDKKVEVDYCPVQNVKKPSGAKPGMVVYDNYRTVVVEPAQEVL